MQEHVESEPPKLEPLIWSVNEDTVDRHRSGGIHLTHRHCVIREETKLQQKSVDMSIIKVGTDIRRQMNDLRTKVFKMGTFNIIEKFFNCIYTHRL